MRGKDKVDAAIGASITNDSGPVQIKVTVGPDRHVGLLVPRDLELTELVALLGYMATKLPATLAAAAGNANAAAPRHDIWVPT